MMRHTTTVALLACFLLATPRASQAGWEEGVAAFKSGDYATAAKEFESMTQQQPDCTQCLMMLGQSLLALKRPQDAVTQLRKAYDLNPSDDSIRLPLAQAYLQAKRYDDAVKLLQTINPSSLPKAKQQVFYQMRAAALDRSGRGEQAIDDLKRAAQANPSDASAQYQYGLACLANRDACAIPALETAVRLDGKDADKKRSLVKALLLQGRQSRGSSKSQAYQRAAEVGQQLVGASGSFENLMLLGEAQLGAKQYDGAISSFQKASSAKSSDWLALYYLGQAQTVRGSFSSAEKSLRDALGKAASNKDQATIWRQLAFVFEKQKNYDDAIAAYNRVGDAAAAERVAENKRIAEENKQVEEYNKQLEELEKQKQLLEEQMKGLPPSR